jgi:hypothetical protein
MSGNVLAIGDYGLCITLAASASPTSSLHFVPCASVSSQGTHPAPLSSACASRAPHEKLFGGLCACAGVYLLFEGLGADT